MTRQKIVKGRTEAIDVAPRAQLIEATTGLLRAHVSGCADRRAGNRGFDGTARRRKECRFNLRTIGAMRTDGFGQPPVDDKCLTIGADKDVNRLDVAMKNATTVGVFDRVADIKESSHQLLQLQSPLTGNKTRHRA